MQLERSEIQPGIEKTGFVVRLTIEMDELCVNKYIYTQNIDLYLNADIMICGTAHSQYTNFGDTFFEMAWAQNRPFFLPNGFVEEDYGLWADTYAVISSKSPNISGT